MYTTNTKSTISAEMVCEAAQQTADPVSLIKDYLSRFSEDPGAIYESEALDALKTIRQKSEADYQRLLSQFKGHKTKLDKLTAPERENKDEGVISALISLAESHCEFVHDADGKGVAIINDGSASQVWYLESSGFEEWLRAKHFDTTGCGLNPNILSSAINTLTAIAKHKGEQREVFLRCAAFEQSYLIDMCDEQWRVIQVQADGWEILQRSPVLFTRNKNMRAFPEPVIEGDLEKLWKYINVPETDHALLLTWLIDCLRPDTPFPVLEICGEQGSAKSTSQRRLRDLIDPNKVSLRGRPKSVEDVYVAAANNWIVSFENLSHLTSEQQDALCTLSTGGGYGARQLYTNGEEHVLETKRPVVLNGINHVATQPDLIERVIMIEAPVIPPELRKVEQDIQKEWVVDYPSVFSGVLSLFSQSLKNLPNVNLDKFYRMADFQKLGEAVSISLGEEQGKFSSLYGFSISEGVTRGLETYGIVHALQVFLDGAKKDYWEGTALDLKTSLDLQLGVDRSNWPKSANAFSRQLKRLAPGLRRIGIGVEHLGRTNKGSKIKVSKIETYNT